MKYEYEVIKSWVECVINEGRNLTEWEQQFIGDMNNRIEKYGPKVWLSDKQVEIIERIYAEKTPT